MIRRLARCIREYKWAAILSPLCMAGEVAMEVLIPLVMADLYDYGVSLQDMHVIIIKSIQLVICALASLSFGAASISSGVTLTLLIISTSQSPTLAKASSGVDLS